jgi:hypothetical protein
LESERPLVNRHIINEDWYECLFASLGEFNLDTLIPRRHRTTGHEDHYYIGGAGKYSAVDTFNAMYRLDDLRQQTLPTWESIDFLLLPTAGYIYRIAEVEADPQARLAHPAALDAGVPFRAVVTDCTYGENPTFEGALWGAELPFVMGLRPSTGAWAPAGDAHTPEEAARRLRWGGPADPGDWTAVERRFRDGHAETWWAVDLVFAGYGPDRSVRLVVATVDPATLPPLSTRYLTTNLPHPGSPRAAESPFPPADLAEVVRLYALRNWVEQGYKQAKHELGWADFQVRADRAIRRHWALVCCAFSFCWRAWFAAPPAEAPAREKRGAAERRRLPLLAADAAASARLAGPLAGAQDLVARLVEPATAPRAAGTDRRRRRRPAARPLPPCLTKYR